MTGKCEICEKELNIGTIDSISHESKCTECMALEEDPQCAEHMAWANGFNAACEMLSADMVADRYGIGNMCSQWSAEEVANDLKSKIMDAFKASH